LLASYLYGLLGAMMTLGVFVCGVVVGYKGLFGTPGPKGQTMTKEQTEALKKAQREHEAMMDALEQTMNYNVDMAYGIGGEINE